MKNNSIRKLPYSVHECADEGMAGDFGKNTKYDTVMSRLVQGDVGSGKTIVAVLALLNTAMNGYQGGNDGADRSIGQDSIMIYL